MTNATEKNKKMGSRSALEIKKLRGSHAAANSAPISVRVPHVSRSHDIPIARGSTILAGKAHYTTKLFPKSHAHGHDERTAHRIQRHFKTKLLC